MRNFKTKKSVELIFRDNSFCQKFFPLLLQNKKAGREKSSQKRGGFRLSGRIKIRHLLKRAPTIEKLQRKKL